MSSLRPALRRMQAASGAMAVYVALRVLTCLLPFMHIIPLAPSRQDVQYGLEVGVLVLALTLLASLPYALVLGSFLSGGHETVRSRRSTLVVVAVGALDLAIGLAIVALTDGWSSEFRHYWTTALMFPCLVLGLRRSLVLAVVCIVATNLVLNLTADPWVGSSYDLLYLQVGWAVSVVVIAAVVGFLGDVVFELQRSKRSAETARDNLETMLEITKYTAMMTTGLNDLMRRMARAIGERHSYRVVGIYVMEAGRDEVRLAGWQGELEVLRRHEQQGNNLVHEAIFAMDARLVRDGRSWNAAIPIRDANSTVGVLLIGTEGSEADVRRMTGLANALAGQIAVGIQVASLRQRLDHAATDQEWERTTRQIHDHISSSLYSLMMYLETYAEQARLEDSPFHRRIEGMMPSFVQLLVETRHYMYHLLPALRGESGLDRVVDSMVAEFERAAEIPVRLTIGGSAAHVPIATTIALYQILQHRMLDILMLSTATEIEIHLEMKSDNISLSISDDGVGNPSGQMDRIRDLARHMGGGLEILNADDGYTKLVLDMSIGSRERSLDHTRDS